MSDQHSHADPIFVVDPPAPVMALPIEERSRTVIAIVIGVGTIISAVIALAIIVSVVLLSLYKQPVPPVLENWGGIILGFYFGQFLSIVKDYTASADIRAAQRRH
jgi:hypothetical protein